MKSQGKNLCGQSQGKIREKFSLFVICLHSG